MLTALIIDDEAPSREELKALLESSKAQGRSAVRSAK